MTALEPNVKKKFSLVSLLGETLFLFFCSKKRTEIIKKRVNVDGWMEVEKTGNKEPKQPNTTP